MGQKDYIVQGIKVKQKAIFDLTELYKLLLRWFKLYGYDNFETEYRDSANEPYGQHLEIKWYADKKESDYIKFVIKTSFLIRGIVDVEIEREGIKTTVKKGEVELKFDAYLEKDYDDKWTGPLQRFLRDIYDRIIIKTRIEGYEKMIHAELYRLIDEAKAFLNIHTF